MKISKFFRPRLLPAIKRKLKAIREKGLKAFTLVELLVVIAIIGILSAAIFIGVGSAQASARDGRRQSELAQTKRALQAYYLQNGRYPTTTDDGISLEDDSDTDGTFSQAMEGSYLPIVPRDPKYSAPAGTYAYKYIATTTDQYTICARTETATGYICTDQTSGGGITQVATAPMFGDWGSGGTGEETVLAIGDSYQGGIIAYILQSGDTGYDANVQHGLIAAPSDQSASAEYGCNVQSGAQGTAIGTGAQNTVYIMDTCATPGIAARLCGDLVLGGYSDWYLPSKDELNQLYLNKAAIGGFSEWPPYYWSSSEYITSASARFQRFDNGFQGTDGKFMTLNVRAVRSF